jgi:GNAT superfamily N-acetyltransferase
MAWQRVADHRRDLFEDFLRRHEVECVNIASRLLRGRPGGPALAVDAEDGRPRNLVYASGHGLVLPVFRLPDSSPAAERLVRRTVGACVRTVIGCAASVENLEKLLDLDPCHRRDYHLMRLDAIPDGFPPGRTDGLDFALASRADAELLFPLQAAYEREEVVISPESFDAGLAYQAFQASLDHELIVYARLDGRPVAKAGTNARGWRWDQIGGVYTWPELRNRGIATALMVFLLGLIGRQGRSACLFVKKVNAPARGMYENLGFSRHDDFAIDYFS